LQSIADSDADVARVLQHAITWPEAQRLHKYEVLAGATATPPRLREKVVDLADMIRIAKQPDAITHKSTE
jgi:hypothetical protein